MFSSGINEAHVWCVNLSEATPHLVESAFQSLSEDERLRASEFAHSKSRDVFVISRSVLRQLLAGFCDAKAEGLHFVYGAHGKPFLAENSREIQFNVSHSADLVAYAITTRHEIGIDIERCRRISNIDAIAGRFFSPEEYEEVQNAPSADRQRTFFDCWVKKEAYVKAIGASFLDAPFQKDMREHWTIHTLQPADGYVGAVAVKAGCALHFHELQTAGDLNRFWEY